MWPGNHYQRFGGIHFQLVLKFIMFFQNVDKHPDFMTSYPWGLVLVLEWYVVIIYLLNNSLHLKQAERFCGENYQILYVLWLSMPHVQPINSLPYNDHKVPLLQPRMSLLQFTFSEHTVKSKEPRITKLHVGRAICSFNTWLKYDIAHLYWPTPLDVFISVL
jgi:hypothetical protein